MIKRKYTPNRAFREIRSYVIREGRMTAGQRNALQLHWSEYGLEVDAGLIEPQAVFLSPAPLVLEIGFGMGDSLFEMARSSCWNFIGVEVHRPGVGHLLQLAANASLENLKLYRADSIDVISKCLPPACLDKVQIFFPDPWHKKRHHKRRLVNPEFVDLFASRLKSGGIVHIATDWAPYADVIRDVMSKWQACDTPQRPITKYERRGIQLQHEVFDLAYRKRQT